MKNFLSSAALATAVMAGAALVSFAPAANAVTIDFTFTSTGDLSAVGTLDVIAGQAVDGSGTVFWGTGSSSSLTLLTATSPLNNTSSAPLLTGVFNGGDAIGDTTYPVDSDGLVFIVGAIPLTANATNIGTPGFNFWSNGGGSYTGYLTSPYEIENGTATFTEVASTPLPSTWLMLISGLAGFGYFACRGTNKNMAVPAAA
jgi:hypothetical protein